MVPTSLALINLPKLDGSGTTFIILVHEVMISNLDWGIINVPVSELSTGWTKTETVKGETVDVLKENIAREEQGVKLNSIIKTKQY